MEVQINLPASASAAACYILHFGAPRSKRRCLFSTRQGFGGGDGGGEQMTNQRRRGTRIAMKVEGRGSEKASLGNNPAARGKVEISTAIAVASNTSLSSSTTPLPRPGRTKTSIQGPSANFRVRRSHTGIAHNRAVSGGC